MNLGRPTLGAEGSGTLARERDMRTLFAVITRGIRHVDRSCFRARLFVS